MRNFFEAIAKLFEEFLFIPFNTLRSVAYDNWWLSNIITWILLLIGVCSAIYWLNELRLSDKRGEEDKNITAHSFL
ncbi:MAG: uracil phosphoribosyltransferase [Flavobacteriaceae bacterium]|nr:uracil phosphoribosyltransferase [Flavobacteriaceae bacterium]|tara:strand:+ start:20444 stop:20671 length:228 start_codon:yes stop_codon:yes gene_type:complete